MRKSTVAKPGDIVRVKSLTVWNYGKPGIVFSSQDYIDHAGIGPEDDNELVEISSKMIGSLCVVGEDHHDLDGFWVKLDDDHRFQWTVTDENIEIVFTT